MPNLKSETAYKTCTVQIIAGFGEEDTAYHSIRPDTAWSEDTLRNAIIRELHEHSRKAMVVAYTTQNQKLANKVFKALGFQHARWCSKKKHPETKLRMWWFPLVHQEIPSLSESKGK